MFNILNARFFQNQLSWFLTIFLIATSGVPVVTKNVPPELLWPVSAAILSAMWFFRSFPRLHWDASVIGFFFAVVVIHALVYGLGPARSSLGVVAMITCVFLSVSLARSFVERYVAVMTFIAAISLVFFLGSRLGIISPAQFNWLPGSVYPDGSVHAWLYHFPTLHSSRNSGPFWEPTAFAGYLIVAILFMVFAEKTYTSIRASVIVLALITTFSTTGFLTIVPLFALTVVRMHSRGIKFSKLALSITAAGMLAFTAVVAFTTLPFLGDKISGHLEMTERRTERFEGTRFGAMLYELEFVRERPIIGWTPSEIPRSTVDSGFLQFYTHAGNGFAGFAAKFGIPALLFYLWRVNFAFRRSGAAGSESLLVVLTVTLLLQSEHFLNFPVFWILAMLRIEPHLRDIQGTVARVGRPALGPGLNSDG